MPLTAQERADYVGPDCPTCGTDRPNVVEWHEITTERTDTVYEPALMACRNEDCPRSL